jgi:hypothetical protein
MEVLTEMLETRGVRVDGGLGVLAAPQLLKDDLA